MNVSPDAEEILKQLRELRAERNAELQRDLHYIDAAYDRQIRRVQSSAIWNRSSCECFSSKPFSARRFCLRRIKWFKRRLARNR